MSWEYDSGGHHKNQGKYAESFSKIFKNKWPCEKCNGTRVQGHKEDCPEHWKNK